MSINKVQALSALVIMAGLAGPALAAPSGSDNFDRTTLGTAWSSVSGRLSISGDQLVGPSLSLGYLTASQNDVSGSQIVFLHGTGLQYGALALGNIAGGSNIFVKLQSQNGDGNFDHAAFYSGNNTGSDFFALSSEVSSPAVMSVGVCGSTAVLRITSAAGVQSYSFDYGTAIGTGGGAGTYGTVAIDNFVTNRFSCKLSAATRPAASMPHAVDLSQLR